MVVCGFFKCHFPRVYLHCAETPPPQKCGWCFNQLFFGFERQMMSCIPFFLPQSHTQEQGLSYLFLESLPVRIRRVASGRHPGNQPWRKRVEDTDCSLYTSLKRCFSQLPPSSGHISFKDEKLYRFATHIYVYSAFTTAQPETKRLTGHISYIV